MNEINGGSNRVLFSSLLTTCFVTCLAHCVTQPLIEFRTLEVPYCSFCLLDLSWIISYKDLILPKEGFHSKCQHYYSTLPRSWLRADVSLATPAILPSYLSSTCVTFFEPSLFFFSLSVFYSFSISLVIVILFEIVCWNTEHENSVQNSSLKLVWLRQSCVGKPNSIQKDFR